MSGHWQMKGHRWAQEYTDGAWEGSLRGEDDKVGIPVLFPTKKAADESKQRWALRCRIVKVRVKYEEIK